MHKSGHGSAASYKLNKKHVDLTKENYPMYKLEDPKRKVV